MSAQSTAQNQRILVIDDNRAIHDDFQKVLCRQEQATPDLDAAESALFGGSTTVKPARTGFQLDSAYQGKDGLDLIKQALGGCNPYALAFVDVRMPPGWDGIETTARIWEVDPDLQIVICTAYSDYSWEEMLRKLGQSDRLVILKKPFDQIEVLQLATSLTKKWQLLQESKNRMADLEKMVASRTAQVVQEQEKFKNIFENSPEGIFQISPDGRLLNANPALAGICGCASPRELLAQAEELAARCAVDPARRAELLQRLRNERIVRDFEVEIKGLDDSQKWISLTACKVPAEDGSLLYYQGFVVDITTQKAAQRDRNLMELHLRQAQKLESVGQLAAGIAHEINTPIQYIGDNIRFVKEAFGDLSKLVTEQQKLNTAVKSVGRQADFDYLNAEVPKAIEQTLEGVNHVANIVKAMKEFSHPGKLEKTPVDVNHAIKTTITVACNVWRYVAVVVADFAPDLPPVPCMPGEFNQVLLNLIVNAAHAIGDVVKDKDGVKGTITVTTRRKDPWVEIRVSDTGTGIPEEIRHRIFEPFFTTKEVGKGTGQGLAISRATIVNKHAGELTFESTIGQGSTFIVRLPLAPKS